MEFSISPIQGIRGYRLEGELDLATVDSLAQRLDEAIDAGGPILLDLSPLKFIDSTGIRAIVQAVTELERRGWCIYLHTDDGGVLRTLEIAGLGKVSNVHLVDHLEPIPPPDSDRPVQLQKAPPASWARSRTGGERTPAATR